MIRGNASEIMAVAGAAGVLTRGVDSTTEPEEALELAKRLALDIGCIVAVSGAVDLVRSCMTLNPQYDCDCRDTHKHDTLWNHRNSPKFQSLEPQI